MNDEPQKPYSRLAEIYDYVMRHVDYVHWADYVESLFERHGVVPGRILDVACGTGSLALELSRRAYDVWGTDNSAEMLGVARKKAANQGYDLTFVQGDLLDLNDLPRFDGVVCLYDSMNYLMSLDEFSQGLAQLHNVVSSEGVLIFDVCTETNSLKYFRNMTDRDEGEGFSYVRHSFYEDEIQYNRFDIRFDKPQEDVTETHRQRIYALQEVQTTIEASPFRIEGSYDGFTLSTPTDRSDRVHFVLRP